MCSAHCATLLLFFVLYSHSQVVVEIRPNEPVEQASAPPRNTTLLKAINIGLRPMTS